MCLSVGTASSFKDPDLHTLAYYHTVDPWQPNCLSQGRWTHIHIHRQDTYTLTNVLGISMVSGVSRAVATFLEMSCIHWVHEIAYVPNTPDRCVSFQVRHYLQHTARQLDSSDSWHMTCQYPSPISGIFDGKMYPQTKVKGLHLVTALGKPLMVTLMLIHWRLSSPGYMQIFQTIDLGDIFPHHHLKCYSLVSPY